MNKERKSIKDISWNVSEEEYRADTALSYSNVARFEKDGWRNISHLFDRIETPSLTFGSAVDTLITGDKEEFERRFVVCKFPPISDTLAKIATMLYRQFGCNYPALTDIPSGVINEVAVGAGYYLGPRYDSFRVKKVREECTRYYDLLQLVGDKQILSQEDYDDAVNCVHELRNSPVTREYLWDYTKDGDIEVVFQAKFRTGFRNIPVRSMFDEILVDHRNKVIHMIDYKTTGNPEEQFEGSIIKFRYDIQAGLYWYILRQVIKGDEYFKDFLLKPFVFIVINRRTVAPLRWYIYRQFEDTNLDLCDENGTVYRNWTKILPELDYYLNDSQRKYSREAINNNYRMYTKLVPSREKLTE